MKKVSLILAIICSALTLFCIPGIIEDTSIIIGVILLFAIPAVLFWIFFARYSKNSSKNSEPKMGNISSFTIDKEKYNTNETYRQKIDMSIKKFAETRYTKNIENAQKQLSYLKHTRNIQIEKIKQSRWQNCKFYSVNFIEGKAKIKNRIVLFSDIKSVELTVIHKSKVEGKTTGSSKSSPNIGGAIIGGALAGSVGAIIGGSGRKETSNYETTSEEFLFCQHIGVTVNLNGTFDEIVFLTKQIDTSNPKYLKIINEAKTLEYQLNELSLTPVPTDVPNIEDAPNIHELDQKIKEAENNVQNAINDKPDFETVKKEFFGEQ